jgi:SAM-dependent methyltransferase
MNEFPSLKYDIFFEELLNELSICSILIYIHSAIPNFKKNCIKINDLILKLKVIKPFISCVHYMLFILEINKIITINKDTITFLIDKSHLTHFEMIKNKLLNLFPLKSKLINTISILGKKYQAVLTGEVSSISILYPNADTNFLNPINQEMDYFSHINFFIEFLIHHLNNMNNGASIKMMEVGAGFGKITWKIAPFIQNKIDYYFTDISRFFIINSKNWALDQNIKFMNFLTFDIDRHPSEQNTPNNLDVILAFNVLHIAKDLNVTLINLKNLLNASGRLIIIENTDLPLWLNMVWGMSEGWWHFQDEYRKNTPLISKDVWKEALLNAGYKNIDFINNHSFNNTPLSLIGILATI